MKTQLTAEQSAELFKRWVSPYKASEIEEYNDAVSKWTHRGQPVFTLADLLEILPKEITIDGSLHHFIMEVSPLGVGWSAGYVNDNHIYRIQTKELIDALYSLYVNCVDDNYLTQKLYD